MRGTNLQIVVSVLQVAFYTLFLFALVVVASDKKRLIRVQPYKPFSVLLI